MLIYILATLLACALAWKGEKAAIKWPWRVASAIPLILVAAMRWDVGTDIYKTYFPAFRALECLNAGADSAAIEQFFGPLLDRLGGGNINTVGKLYANFLHVLGNQEWGFRKIMEFMAWSGLGFRGIVVLTSLLTGALVFTAIYRQSHSPVLAIYLYVATSNYFLGLNIIRQYVAIGFALVAVEFIVRRKLLPFLACIGAGMLFHTTVVLMLPCYFICRIPIKPIWGFVLLAVLLAVSSYISPIVMWLMPKIGMGHYCRYFGRYQEFLGMFLSINVCVLALGGWYWERARKKSPYFLVWYNMTILGSIALCFSTSLPLMKRINYFFAAPHFLLLPEILLNEERLRVRRWLGMGIVVAFACETWVAVWLMNKNEPLPYSISPVSNHQSLRPHRYAARSWWCVSEGHLEQFKSPVPDSLK